MGVPSRRFTQRQREQITIQLTTGRIYFFNTETPSYAQIIAHYGLKVKKKIAFRIYKNLYCYGLWNTLKKILGVNNEDK